MLVLSRRLQEAIKIGNDIEITVLTIEGDQVKLGISAPKNIEILRKEIYLTIQEENNQAVLTSLNTINQIKLQKNISKSIKK
ncbi:carbon storage regulator CsrA [Fictibacillus sp. 23RED33]|jgi:carbon storage regulator|uniref:carbon storage regulator CsrA n=1 Tax=Fictibacillus sp. 23RED33 TaxID=2745879 RepID=UPI0018CDE608|nr:carbon storage regulator CsrA [Fictibacillus sp. 23RED33]MBH0173828.1 carbon storage regulator CsrA [Fictibacillus sp. 23RED33]